MRRTPSVPARLLRALLRPYQAWSAARPRRCRFEPSCSHYAYDAISVYGALRGAWLALRRVVRCRPGGGFGYDPVPERLGVATTGRPPRRARGEVSHV